MADSAGMNDHERATFLRRLAALLIDTGVVLFLGSVYFGVWASFELGGLPETPLEFAAIFAVGQLVVPGFQAQALIAYVFLSFTPILGRRTIGMRQVGISVVRDDHARL